MIYCVWYPSGGFGHFINAVLTLHGDNFVRPNNSLNFSKNGDSHNLQLVVPKYRQEQWSGIAEFLDNKNYCVLIDNGINNESDQFKSVFPDASVIQICYSDRSWPIVARTMIDKAMKSSLDQQLPLDKWDSDEPWAKREKYFLFLRDHPLRHAWKPTVDWPLYVDNLLSYESLFNSLNSLTKVNCFNELWIEWRKANSKYIDPVEIAQKVIAAINFNQPYNLSGITDIWTQAVVYYYIWITFGVEVPHNDFSDFFSDINQIAKLVL